jgi:hypothetical protein
VSCQSSLHLDSRAARGETPSRHRIGVGCDLDSTGQAPLPRTPHSGTSKKLARLFPYFEVVVAGGPESKIKVIALRSASSGRLRNLTQSLACLSAGN